MFKLIAALSTVLLAATAQADVLPKIAKLSCTAGNGVKIKTLDKQTVRSEWAGVYKDFDAEVVQTEAGEAMITLKNYFSTYMISLANLDLSLRAPQRHRGTLLAPNYMNAEAPHYVAKIRCTLTLE